MIADLPGETASAMLKTLSTTGNEPIKHHAVIRRADPPQQRARLLLLYAEPVWAVL